MKRKFKPHNSHAHDDERKHNRSITVVLVDTGQDAEHLGRSNNGRNELAAKCPSDPYRP